MTLSVKQTQAKKLNEVRAALARPQYVHLSCRILVHEPAPPGSKPCPCCGSVFARIAEEHDDGELIIDRQSGRRILPHQLRPETWAKAVAVAEHHDIVYRVSRDQYPLLVDESHKHQFITGTMRAGKTQLALVWLCRQWCKFGGRRRRFWLCANDRTSAFDLLGKIFDGDDDTPPILPSALAVKRPANTSTKPDPYTIMVDGSIWQIRMFDGDTTGKRFKKVKIVAGITDEAAEIKHEKVLVNIEGRCLDRRGRLFFSTTPVGGSFLKESLVDKCDEWERMTPDHPAKVAGEHVGARWSSHRISHEGNPWQDPEAIAYELRTKNLELPENKRQWLGLWVSDHGKFWVYDDDRHTFHSAARSVADMMRLVNQRARGGSYVREKEYDLQAVWKWGVDEHGNPLPERPQKRITPVIAQRLFQRRDNPGFKGFRASNLNYLLGTDINGGSRPSNTVILEVTGDASKPDDPDLWHFWVFDVKETWGDSLKHGKELSSTFWTRQWDAAATVSPYKNCGMIIDPQSIIRNPTAHRYGGNPQGIIEEYAKLGFDSRYPQYIEGIHPIAHLPRGDSHGLIRTLLDEGRLHISGRCATNLIKSFHTQETAPNGREPIKDDIPAGPVDALRYVIHACLKGGGALPKSHSTG